LRTRVRQAETDSGKRSGRLSGEQREEIREQVGVREKYGLELGHQAD
jgi:hypothetical protein